MSVLVDSDIRFRLNQGQLGIDPYFDENLQPASYDVHLDHYFRVFSRKNYSHIDVRKRNADLTELINVQPGDTFLLHPQDFVLATTIETFKFPGNIVGRLEGKSSLARYGLLIHSTAGFFDPGFVGQATLELSNVAPIPIILFPGMKIAQMSFIYCSTFATRPYGSSGLNSKYQDQKGPQPSEYWRNYESGESSSSS